MKMGKVVMEESNAHQKRELFPTASVIADGSHIAKKRRGQLYSGIWMEVKAGTNENQQEKSSRSGN